MFIGSNFSRALSDAAIKHITYDWSHNEQGIRHPHIPEGICMRDNGFVDIYAGKSKLLLGLRGEVLLQAAIFQSIAERISFVPRGIENFRILGKHFNKEIFKGQKLLTLKNGESIDNYSVIGPQTVVIMENGVGKIINSVPLTSFIEVKELFEEYPDPPKAHQEIIKILEEYDGRY